VLVKVQVTVSPAASATLAVRVPRLTVEPSSQTRPVSDQPLCAWSTNSPKAARSSPRRHLTLDVALPQLLLEHLQDRGGLVLVLDLRSPLLQTLVPH